MKILNKTTEELLDSLALIAICANGGFPIDENGEGYLPEDLKILAESYARSTFIKIMGEWEETLGEKWEII